MTDRKRKVSDKLDRFYNALAADLDNLTDEELLAEAKEDGEDIESIAVHMTELISETIEETGRLKLAAARAALDNQKPMQGSKVLQLPLARKQALIESLAKNDNDLGGKMTLAARSGKDTEADIDSFLEDLVALGVIDDEGNTT